MEQVKPNIEPGWGRVLEQEFRQPYFLDLKKFLQEEKRRHKVYPPGSQIFAAFDSTPFDQVRVVILGQDPYHGAGQAHGLCFSVPEGVKQPPSLQNILKELHDDLGFAIPAHGSLFPWARQGVLLLNATLTVRANTPGSHQGKGWERFTDEAIQALSRRSQGIVFMLWGNYARAKAVLIDAGKHLILEAPHPSPFSANRGFFGCRHFSKANEHLLSQDREAIDWRL